MLTYSILAVMMVHVTQRTAMGNPVVAFNTTDYIENNRTIIHDSGQNLTSIHHANFGKGNLGIEILQSLFTNTYCLIVIIGFACLLVILILHSLWKENRPNSEVNYSVI